MHDAWHMMCSKRQLPRAPRRCLRAAAAAAASLLDAAHIGGGAVKEIAEVSGPVHVGWAALGIHPGVCALHAAASRVSGIRIVAEHALLDPDLCDCVRPSAPCRHGTSQSPALWPGFWGPRRPAASSPPRIHQCPGVAWQVFTEGPAALAGLLHACKGATCSELCTPEAHQFVCDWREGGLELARPNLPCPLHLDLRGAGTW